jgi:rhodanese-related sulfurtransferase
MGELLVPAAMMVAFTVIYYLFRPDPARGRAVERYVIQGAHIVDVRPPQDFQQGHVSGARSVPLATLPGDLPPADRVIVYGRSDEDSAAAALALKDAGFARVIDAGPMSHWPIPQPG